MRRIRPHLSYANVMATIAVFIAISGGTAVALGGANTVQSDDLGPGAQVKAPDVAAGSVGSTSLLSQLARSRLPPHAPLMRQWAPASSGPKRPRPAVQDGSSGWRSGRLFGFAERDSASTRPES